MPRKLLARAPAANTESATVSAPEPDADELELDARAAAARARATRLRAQAETAAREQDNTSGSGGDDAAIVSGERTEPTPVRPRRLRRPGRRTVAVAVAALIACAALAGNGYLFWHHSEVVKQRQRGAEFAAVARDAVIMMISLNPAKARDDMQRFADSTTGMFKAGILMSAEDAVKALEQSKVSSMGTVQAVAVESMTKDSALVLVTAKAEFAKPGEAKPQSQRVRLAVTVQRENGQLKISRIEFIP
jgi:Mce-associated membrane protein